MHLQGRLCAWRALRLNRSLIRASLVIAAAAAAACGSNTPSDSDAGGPLGWQTLIDGDAYGRAVLSVWGPAPDDVFFAGGSLGNGLGALALHYRGGQFTELETGASESLWWVSGTGADDVWMVGEEGAIIHYDGERFARHDSGTTATLFGVIAFSKTDAWAVGGTPEGGVEAPNDVVLRWDGVAWSKVALPGEPLGRALYKVWGSSSSDLYAVGEFGTIWRRSGEAFALVSDPPLAQGTLFTVVGCGEGEAREVYAVGGFDVLRKKGEGASPFERVEVSLSAAVNGVACTTPGEAVIAGFGGSKQRLSEGAWVDEFDVPPTRDLHAAWADGTGVYWVVGGDFVSKPSPGRRRIGTIGRYGPSPP